MRRARRRVGAVVAGAVLLSRLGAVAAAPAVDAPTADPRDVALAARVDAVVPGLLERHAVPGAAIAIVRGGRSVLVRGFGVADTATGEPVDPERSRFRIASVSKVFSAALALQAVERGDLGLDDDLRRLIPELADDPHAPVTLRRVLTHTAGFDERLIGYLNRPQPSPTSPAASLLEVVQDLPARHATPADVPGYSNYAFAALGLAVERLRGRPFAEVARSDLFAPLGMERTSFELDPARADLVAEYKSTGERRAVASSRPYPAGNVATTAADMQRFLLAFARARAIGEHETSGSVLTPRIARWLASPQLVYHPALPGMGFALSGAPYGDRVVWMKGGASPSHSAVLALLPDADLAVFIAVNRQEPLFWEDLLQEILAAASATEPAPEGSWTPLCGAATAGAPVSDDVSPWVGHYLWTRAAVESPERLLGLAAQLNVAADGAGGLRVSGSSELAGRWEPCASGVYRRADGRLLAFRRPGTAPASHVFSVVEGQPVSFARIAPWRSTAVEVGDLLLATALIAIAALARRPVRDGRPRWARWSGAGVLLAEAVAVGAAVAVARGGEALAFGPTPAYRAALASATLLALLAMVDAAGGALLASTVSLRTGRRILLWAGVAGDLGLLWFLWNNRLVLLP